jgi:hypothetical protein
MVRNLPFEPQYSATIRYLEAQSIVAHVRYLDVAGSKEFQVLLIMGEIVVNISLSETPNGPQKYQSFSYYPAAKWDIALIVDGDYPAQGVIDEVQAMGETIAKGIFTAVEIGILTSLADKSYRSTGKVWG